MNDGALLDLLLVSGDDQLGLFDLGFEPLDFRQRFGKNLSSVFVAGFQLFEQCLVFDNELSMPLDFAIFDRHDPAPLNDRPSGGLEKEKPRAWKARLQGSSTPIRCRRHHHVTSASIHPRQISAREKPALGDLESGFRP
jgi:hypothetical protein